MQKHLLFLTEYDTSNFLDHNFVFYDYDYFMEEFSNRKENLNFGVLKNYSYFCAINGNIGNQSHSFTGLGIMCAILWETYRLSAHYETNVSEKNYITLWSLVDTLITCLKLVWL